MRASRDQNETVTHFQRTCDEMARKWKFDSGNAMVWPYHQAWTQTQWAWVFITTTVSLVVMSTPFSDSSNLEDVSYQNLNEYPMSTVFTKPTILWMNTVPSVELLARTGTSPGCPFLSIDCMWMWREVLSGKAQLQQRHMNIREMECTRKRCDRRVSLPERKIWNYRDDSWETVYRSLGCIMRNRKIRIDS